MQTKNLGNWDSMVHVILKQSFLSRQPSNAMTDPPTPPLSHNFALSEKQALILA